MGQISLENMTFFIRDLPYNYCGKRCKYANAIDILYAQLSKITTLEKPIFLVLDGEKNGT